MSTESVLSAGTGVGTYVHWGVIQISVGNLVVIGLMVVLFVLALVLPFPSARSDRTPEDRS